MKKIPKLYGLYSETKQCYMGADFTSNDGADCAVDVEVQLSAWTGYGPIWHTTKKSDAEDVAQMGPAGWYNADWDSPTWNQQYYGDLTVVELT